MQHRLRKVLSSYTFSSSTLQDLDDDGPGEEQRLRQGATSDQLQRPQGQLSTAAAGAAAVQHAQQQPLETGQRHDGCGTNGVGTGISSIARM